MVLKCYLCINIGAHTSAPRWKGRAALSGMINREQSGDILIDCVLLQAIYPLLFVNTVEVVFALHPCLRKLLLVIDQSSLSAPIIPNKVKMYVM